MERASLQELIAKQPVLPNEAFKGKTLTVNDTLIQYTHVYPAKASNIKLSFKERVRILFGEPLVLNLNIYLNGAKVVHTNIVLSTLKSLLKAQKRNY